MKAAQIAEYGDTSVIHVNEIETPTLADGQVLVEVYASSLNPFDSKVREGYAKCYFNPDGAFTLGGDISGVIKESQGNNTFKVGDKVYGQAAAVAGNSGAFAELAATSAGEVAIMPNNLSFEEAASIPLVGVSALQALTQHIKLQPGQKLFINGGSGGIGTIAIQIAKDIGAFVATTATGEGIEFAKKLGADRVIDYKSDDFKTLLSDYDAMFDTVGSDDFSDSFNILKSGGIAVSMVATPDDEKANKFGIQALTQGTKVDTKILDSLRELIERGVIKPQVSQVFKLDQIQEAFNARETGSVRGKVVISIK